MSDATWDPASTAREAGLGRTLRGFAIQGRVIHALLLREMQTRFGRNQLGFLWLFIEPLLLAVAIGAIKSVYEVGHHPGISPFVFALVSYLPYFTFRAIVGRAAGTLQANMTLLYHSHIKLIDVVLARHLLEMGAVMTVMALITAGVAIYSEHPPASIPTLVFGLLMLFLLAQGLGLLAAAVSAVSEVAERLIHPLLYLSLPLSGALISLDTLPANLREILLWNPQANIHELVREGFFGSLIHSYYDVGYVLFCVGLLNVLGLAALRAVRPRLLF